MLSITDDQPRYPEQGCSLQVYHLVAHHIKCHLLPSSQCVIYAHDISSPVIDGIWHTLWSWHILACHYNVIIIFLLSPVFTPTVWGCIGLIMLIMGPILWILHRTTPYYEYVGVQKCPQFCCSSQIPRYVLKTRTLQHQLLFLHLLWKPAAARLYNSPGCRQRVTISPCLPCLSPYIHYLDHTMHPWSWPYVCIPYSWPYHNPDHIIYGIYP